MRKPDSRAFLLVAVVAAILGIIFVVKSCAVKKEKPPSLPVEQEVTTINLPPGEKLIEITEVPTRSRRGMGKILPVVEGRMWVLTRMMRQDELPEVYTFEPIWLPGESKTEKYIFVEHSLALLSK